MTGGRTQTCGTYAEGLEEMWTDVGGNYKRAHMNSGGLESQVLTEISPKLSQTIEISCQSTSARLPGLSCQLIPLRSSMRGQCL